MEVCPHQLIDFSDKLNNWKLARKHDIIASHEVRYETFRIEDAKGVVSFGTAARIARGTVKR